MVAAVVVPLAVTALLRGLHVPLGCPGRLVYLYSPVMDWRLSALPAVLVLAGAVAVGVGLTTAAAAHRRRAGFLIVMFGVIALAVWSYFAPPDHYEQHVFNALSPSHDGAFVMEALAVDSAREYLRFFPQRARTPPEEMRGTRVISNPPGATLLAFAARRLVELFPDLTELTGPPRGESLPSTPPFEWLRYSSAVGLVFFWLLMGLWLCAGVFLYHVGRLFWPPVVAAAYAVCCVFSPMTLLFTPGKDPAQLLTVAVPLYLWIGAVRQHRGGMAGLAGGMFVLSSLMGLVHIWLAVIVAVATWWSAWREPRDAGRGMWRLIVPAAGGAVLAATMLYVLCGLDLIATVRAVARAQSEVTRGVNAMPLAWQLLGVPLFLLFAGPAWWTITLWSCVHPSETTGPAEGSRPHAVTIRFGRDLLIVSAAVLLATVGFTNLETPRLWISFLPLLLLGALLRIEALREPSRRVAIILAVLTGVQIAGTALQWVFMDMREAETRLREGIFFG